VEAQLSHQEIISMKTRRLAGLCCIVLLGCGQTEPVPPKPTGPSYAEALNIYKQEFELLEQLKSSATAATAAHEERLARLKSSLALGDAVQDLNALTDLAAAGNLLDEESTAKAKAASDKARSQLTEAGAKAKAEIEAAVKEHEARMAKLNQEIQEQEEKVSRAKRIKDEAEKQQ
jgi:hypothetical protein